MLSVTYFALGRAPVTVTFSETTTAAEQTKMIQQALDAVAGQSGATVTLSAGTFTIAGTGKAADGGLRVGSETTLQGAGQGATTLKLADGSTACTGIIRTDSGKTLPDGSLSSVSNVTVRGLTIDGNMARTSGEVDGFYSGPKPGTVTAEDRNILLENIEIKNCSRYGFDPHEGTRDLTIRNSSSHHNGKDGFTIDGTINVTLENCVAYDNGRHGINLVTGTENARIINSSAQGNGGSGLVVQTGDNELRGFTAGVDVIGGTFAGNGRAGIDVRQADDIDIRGAIVSAGTSGGDAILLQGVNGATITNTQLAVAGGTVPLIASDVRVAHYLQTFGDTDVLNDVLIATSNVTINGVTVAAPATTTGVPLLTARPTHGDDVINGSDGRDVVAAGRGNDTVNGGLGRDMLYGNDGDDRLDGGADDDQLFGGWGNDRLYYSGGVDRLDGGAGTDAADFIRFVEAVNVDLMRTFMEAQSLTGAARADFVSIENVKGTRFNDVIAGNDSANSLEGFDGNDRLMGRGGNDRLTGGSGNDVFVFDRDDGRDTISDFNGLQDRIALSGATSFADLTITSTSSGASIAFGQTTILLTGVSASGIGVQHFLFE
ncbi:MAG: hypothetical protein RL291_1490 [Pseudomonadota bacterium]